MIEINLESAVSINGPANPRKTKAFSADMVVQKGGRFTVTNLAYERLALAEQGLRFSQLVDKRIVALVVPESEASALTRKVNVVKKGRSFTDRRLAVILNAGENEEVAFNLEPTQYPNAFVINEIRRVNTETNVVTEASDQNNSSEPEFSTDDAEQENAEVMVDEENPTTNLD